MEKANDHDIKTYRAAIWDAMLEKISAADGKIDEREARALLEQLTDDELADGILFNTPEEVADILLEM